MPVELKVVSVPGKAYAFTNCVYVAPLDFNSLADEQAALGVRGVPCTADDHKGYGMLVNVGHHIFSARPLEKVAQGTVALGSNQRELCNSRLDQVFAVRPFEPPHGTFYLGKVSFMLDLLARRKPPQPIQVDCAALAESIKATFPRQVLSVGQKVCHQFSGANFQMVVTEVAHVSLEEQNGGQGGAAATPSSSGIASQLTSQRGLLQPTTDITFTKTAEAALRLSGQAQKRGVNKILEVDFEKLGIGGLNKEFADIFRRAFASRIFPPDVVDKMGIHHVRGLMLYGPPGCGKTLIARQISKVLQGEGDGDQCREPKIVNGPEILNKYVGASEENIRELFKDAEAEQAEMGDQSELHVIIFDEIDAICKSRGSSRDGTGVGDSVVNQLLSKIDGVNSLHNVLLIGMTNRLDMLDPALLRPGRFEVQIEIGLPDLEGRTQIVKIHTRKMRDAGYLGPSVDVGSIADRTNNFSGAEIEGLVKSAASYAFQRQVNIEDLSKPIDPANIKVHGSDFDHALLEVKPAFGVEDDSLKLCFRNGIIPYGESFTRVTDTMRQLIRQVQTSDRTPQVLLSVLLAGPSGCGKTALAAKLAMESGFPYVKMISADSLIGYSETSKCSKIASVFDDAYKSPLSMIIIDDVERVLDFVQIGPRFSNQMLQAMLVLVKKVPPVVGRSLMVVGTTSVPHLLDEMELTKVFNVTLNVPQLETAEEVLAVLERASAASGATFTSKEELNAVADGCSKPIGIKKLLLVLEMARQDIDADGDVGLEGQGSGQADTVTFNRFMECLHNVGFV